MNLIALHPGLAYGAGTASTDLLAGDFVKLTGSDLFSKVNDASDHAFGMVYRDVSHGDYTTIYTSGGIYEIDSFTTGITAGDQLEVDPATGLLRKATTGQVVARAITVSATELKFKLVI